jgi:hopene-associated glycosyltransferase HpnB
MTALIIGSLACVAWMYLLAARGGFWRATERDDVAATIPPAAFGWPRVVAVVPARDEADVVGGSIGSLLRQDYRGEFVVIVVDDHSIDDTAAVAQNAAVTAEASGRVIVLAAPSLPDGWTGKLWALHQGVTHALSLTKPPDYVLLTDADIHHTVDTLTQLVLRATRDHTVLTSLMARLRCESAGERAMIPAFIFFFQMLYPFAWVNRPERPTAAAAGGCMLVHRQSLQAAGGVAAIRGELIDDCALARLLKRHGPIWLGLTERVQSVRAYPSVAGIRRMIVRSAYAQLGFSPWWLALTALAMAVAYMAPPVLVLSGGGMPRLLGALAWVQMAVAFQPTLQFYRVSPWWGLALPAIAGAYLLFTLESAYRHMRGSGGEWKGRIHWRTSGR